MLVLSLFSFFRLIVSFLSLFFVYLMSSNVCFVLCLNLILFFVSFNSIIQMDIGVISGEITICHMNVTVHSVITNSLFLPDFSYRQMIPSSNTSLIITFIFSFSLIQIYTSMSYWKYVHPLHTHFAFHIHT